MHTRIDPFRVVVTYRNGNTCTQKAYNFNDLGGALNRMAIEKANGQVRCVEIYMSITIWDRDEQSRELMKEYNSVVVQRNKNASK